MAAAFGNGAKLDIAGSGCRAIAEKILQNG
jgi:hypothetical protein